MSTANPFATPAASTGNLTSEVEAINNTASSPSQVMLPAFLSQQAAY